MPRILNSFNFGTFGIHHIVPDDSTEEPCASILVKADADTLLITEVVIEGDFGGLALPFAGMSVEEFQRLVESDDWEKALHGSFTYHKPNTNDRYIAFLANQVEEATE